MIKIFQISIVLLYTTAYSQNVIKEVKLTQGILIEVVVSYKYPKVKKRQLGDKLGSLNYYFINQGMIESMNIKDSMISFRSGFENLFPISTIEIISLESSDYLYMENGLNHGYFGEIDSVDKGSDCHINKPDHLKKLFSGPMSNHKYSLEFPEDNGFVKLIEVKILKGNFFLVPGKSQFPFYNNDQHCTIFIDMIQHFNFSSNELEMFDRLISCLIQ